MRLIDADALMKELGITSDDCCECEWGDGHGYCTRTSDFTDACDSICTALPIEPESQWIPCSERLPDDLEEVNVTWVNHNPVTYYDFTKDKPFTATAVYYRKKWHWYSSACADILAEYGKNEVDEIDDAIEIIAWMPLPEPFTPDDFSQHMNPPED